MMRHSLIEPKELKMEESVVLEEIKRGEDEPSDHVHEVHLEERWGKHPFGKPVIGTRESVSSFERNHLTAYMDRRYRGGNVLLGVAGNVDPELVGKWAEARLGDIPSGGGLEKIDRPKGTKKETYQAKEVEQVHFCIGSDGTSLYDEDLYVNAVMDAALGGSMSSRLFQEIREKRGLAYSVGSYSLSYTAGGAYTVYGGTAHDTWDKVQELVRVEFDKLMKSGLEDEELARTKRHICGNIVLALEGMSSRMMRMSKNELFHEREIPIEETIKKINAVTNEKLVDLARRTLDEGAVSTTAIGPA
jgi:predicted Zn-dependent peptidase